MTKNFFKYTKYIKLGMKNGSYQTNKNYWKYTKLQQ